MAARTMASRTSVSRRLRSCKNDRNRASARSVVSADGRTLLRNVLTNEGSTPIGTDRQVTAHRLGDTSAEDPSPGSFELVVGLPSAGVRSHAGGSREMIDGNDVDVCRATPLVRTRAAVSPLHVRKRVALRVCKVES